MHVSCIAESGVVVLLSLGIRKILCSHEWWVTATVLALTEKAAAVRYAKYGFQQRPSRYGSQKPVQKVSSQLFDRTTLYWALWFQHNKCTSPGCGKSQRQYYFEDTSRATFPLLWCGGKPKILLGVWHWPSVTLYIWHTVYDYRQSDRNSIFLVWSGLD